MTITENIFLFPYYLLIVIGLTFPADANHGIFSPKSLIYLSAVLATSFFVILKKRLFTSQLKLICFFGFFLTFLVFWIIYGLLIDDSNVHCRLDQTKLFIITLSPPLITYTLLYEKKISSSQIMRLMIFSNFFYCLAKVLLIFGHLLGLVDMWTLLRSLGFLIHKMTMFGKVSRMQTSLDITAPFLLFFVLQSGSLKLELSKKFKMLYILITLLSNIFAFSRFLLGVYALSIALHIFTLKPQKMVKGFLLILITLLIGSSFVGFQNVASAIEARFFSKANSISDQIRVEQVNALLKKFSERPYFGQGVGAYTKSVIRSRSNPHSYEVQWIAFLMQFGIFGTAILLLPLFFIFFRFYQLPLSRDVIACQALFLIWLVSGFTNPFLISLQSGIIYTLFLLFVEAKIYKHFAIHVEMLNNENPG